jgi:hypothetical protein
MKFREILISLGKDLCSRDKIGCGGEAGVAGEIGGEATMWWGNEDRVARIERDEQTGTPRLATDTDTRQWPQAILQRFHSWGI